ncbi:MAG: tetratricopeptide repeat protein [Bacillota bacterium]
MDLTAFDQLIAGGRVGEALQQMQQALTGDLAPADRFALELKTADTLLWYLTDPMASLTHYGEALTLAREHHLPEIHRAEMGIGQALHQQGRPDQALLYLEMAAVGAGAAGDALAQAAALAVQGNILMEMGEYVEAAQLMERAEGIARELGETVLRAQATASLALLQSYLERYEEAEELGRSAVALAKESGDVGLVAIAYLRMGQIMYQQDRFGPAYYWFKAGGEVAREAGLEHLIQVFDEAVEATGVLPQTEEHDHDHDHEDH